MSTADRFAALATLEGMPVNQAYCRIVPNPVLQSRTPPEFLFTSGKAGRYNEKGVLCIYASEDLPTAGAESERYREGRTVATTTYWLHMEAKLLDLAASDVLEALQLTTDDLFRPWRGLSVSGPTATQLLGSFIAQQTKLSGIRFPSDAARERGFTGFNIVVFRQALVAPWSVIVSSDDGAPLARWP